jgi:serine/threonine protein kinase
VEGAATPIDDAFELLEMLGKGSYGSVYRGRARANGELFAIKVIPLAEGVRLHRPSVQRPSACAAAGTAQLRARRYSAHSRPATLVWLQR